MLWPSGDPDKSSPSSWPQGLYPLIWPFLAFWTNTALMDADKSAVTDDITHTDHFHPRLPGRYVTICQFQSTFKWVLKVYFASPTLNPSSSAGPPPTQPPAPLQSHLSWINGFPCVQMLHTDGGGGRSLPTPVTWAMAFTLTSKCNETYIRRSHNTGKGRSNFGCTGKIKVFMCYFSFRHQSKHGLKELSDWYYTYLFKAVRSELDGISVLVHDDFFTVLHSQNIVLTIESKMTIQAHQLSFWRYIYTFWANPISLSWAYLSNCNVKYWTWQDMSSK